MIAMTQLDHLVLTVKDIPTSVAFYTHFLGMEKQEFAGGRIALNFGQQKINLHQWQHEFEPKAGHVQPGSADLCFITNTPIQEVATWFTQRSLRGLHNVGLRWKRGRFKERALRGQLSRFTFAIQT
ncbi:VOC family protein [Vibrio vulnificus]|uniref:VOC family protein n=1 Tax=Vibrio vulnificus TaxID=672 RepID=UPI003C12F9AA